LLDNILTTAHINSKSNNNNNNNSTNYYHHLLSFFFQLLLLYCLKLHLLLTSFGSELIKPVAAISGCDWFPFQSFQKETSKTVVSNTNSSFPNSLHCFKWPRFLSSLTYKLKVDPIIIGELFSQIKSWSSPLQL
jgi:hypothetical protein